ncbi:MAG TPA: hypothetical protein PLF40_15760, partial [Kofleriaceae bacterium]|nr:hypothetical protein [Kofleriaceae bacterium]
MELEQLEALAFGSQQSWSERADARSGARSAAAANLVAGTQDYDYFVCIRAQQAGKFAEAQTIIDAWPNRYGRNQQLARLVNRQMLLRWRAAPSGADALALARHVGVELHHEPADRPVDESLPSKLDASLVAQAALLQTCLDDYSLSNATDYALPRLLRMKLSEAQRSTLLDRLPPSTATALIGLVVDDIKPSFTYFGRRNIYN